MVRKIYNRSVSFPIPSSSWRSSSPKIKGRGSASFPCRFRHFVTPLQEHIHSLLTWRSCPDHQSAVWIITGTIHLDHLQASLDDLLQHPKAQDQLRRRSAWTDRMLEDFLLFADAYASFRSAVIDLKDSIAATRAAICRHNGAKTSSCLREQKRVEKEVLKIAAGARRVGSWGLGEQARVNEEEAELAATMKEVVLVMGMATAEVFGGVAMMAAAAVGGKEARRCTEGLGSACMVGSILRRMGSMKRIEEEEEKWRSDKVEKLEKVEECIGEVEKGSERLFKSLVNSRVFLLNTLTPCI